MIKKVQIAPSNSLILIMDADAGEIPESMGTDSLVATSSSLAVGTLSQQDGKTSVVLSDERASLAMDSSVHCIFHGNITTPRRLLSVCDVLLEEVLTVPVKGTRTDLEVWTNRTFEPSRIHILFDATAAAGNPGLD